MVIRLSTLVEVSNIGKVVGKQLTRIRLVEESLVVSRPPS